jgi:uncharacterized protein (DUF1778 family)
MGEKDRRTSRMNMRLTPDDLALLKTGAHTQHQDLTTFVLEAALERARQVINEPREVTGNFGLAAFE